jgi:hypothetical protein
MFYHDLFTAATYDNLTHMKGMMRSQMLHFFYSVYLLSVSAQFAIFCGILIVHRRFVLLAEVQALMHRKLYSASKTSLRKSGTADFTSLLSLGGCRALSACAYGLLAELKRK